MQFFSSFHSLGYSAINIVLLWLVIVAVGYKVLALHMRPIWMRLAYIAVLIVPLVVATNFLADQNRLLNDAIREDGGIKQNFPKITE